MKTKRSPQPTVESFLHLYQRKLQFAIARDDFQLKSTLNFIAFFQTYISLFIQVYKQRILAFIFQWEISLSLPDLLIGILCKVTCFLGSRSMNKIRTAFDRPSFSHIHSKIIAPLYCVIQKIPTKQSLKLYIVLIMF